MGDFPSRDHQFGPGNQASKGHGRPKGKTLKTLLREIGELALKTPATLNPVDDLVQSVLAAEGDAGWLLTANQAGALRLWAIALHDEDSSRARAALRLIMDHTDGRPIPARREGDGEPTVIRVEYADPDAAEESDDDADPHHPSPQAPS